MKWQINQVNNYNHYMQTYKLQSLVSKVLALRKYDDETMNRFLSNNIKYHDFSLFSDSDIVLDRIEEAIENEEKICIYGDYDCDGILSTTILVQAFLERGIQVGYHIPHRSKDGYGITKQRVEQIIEKGYSLIITVDNGIKSYEAIEYAANMGVDVIVVDHHSFDELPDATAIIHTKISPEYPFKELCGGFLAYKLASAMLEKHDKYLYCLAAITTISDMMPLIDENRSLVKRALEFMKQEKYPQLEALIGKMPYTSTNIAFYIAPKINSFGRLPEMVNPNHLVKYFLKNASQSYIEQISSMAEQINTKRKNMTASTYQSVLENVEHDDFLYVYDQEIHDGIVGLVAGRYKNDYQRPSFVMSYSQEHNIYKGSARSLDVIPLTKIFEDLKPYFKQAGGHALAGGFSVEVNQVEHLKEALSNYLSHIDFVDEKEDVIVLDKQDLTIPAIEQLDVLEPFGMSNSEPLFYLGNINQFTYRELSQGNHLRFDINYQGVKLAALYFNCKDKIEELKQKQTLNIVGKLKINEYNHIKSINIIISDII